MYNSQIILKFIKKRKKNNLSKYQTTQIQMYFSNEEMQIPSQAMAQMGSLKNYEDL